MVKTREDLYDTWDDFAFTPAGQFFTGLPVAHSTDGGATWHLVYATSTARLSIAADLAHRGPS